MGAGLISNQDRSDVSKSSKLRRKLHQDVHLAVIQVLWMRQHSPLHKKLSFNITREICSYLAGDYRKLVLVLQSEVKYFDIDRKKWNRLWKMRSNIVMEKFVWTLVAEYKIFICGGMCPPTDYDGHHRDGHVCIVHLGQEAFMLKEDGRVYSLTKMTVARYKHAVLYHAGEVYVFGGVNRLGEAHNLRSCEKYSVSTNQWQDLPDMCEPRCYFSPCWHLSVVYLCGGWRRSVETFDPASNTFTLLLDLTLPEGGWCLAVVNSDGELVAITKNSISKKQQWRFETKRHSPYQEYTGCPPLVQRELVYVVCIGSNSEKKSSSVHLSRLVYTCYGISLDTGEPMKLG